MLIPYPLKQSFLDYFQLNQIDNTITIDKLIKYMERVIHASPDPNQKALEIWDTFVMNNENFFDMPSTYDMHERVKRMRQEIIEQNNIHYTLLTFGCVGVSPFCDPWTRVTSTHQSTSQ